MADAGVRTEQGSVGGALTAEEAAYMTGGKEPVRGSVPATTSRFLDSPLFSHAYTVLSLRRLGDDVAITYDIPAMQRALGDVADPAAMMRALAEERAINPAFAAWLDRRRFTSWNAGQLAPHAAGTLGGTMRAFIVDSGMQIEFMNKDREIASDIDYIYKRHGASHDIQHMVTGFGPSIAGETALAMMNVTSNAKFFNPALAEMISLPNLFVSSGAYMRGGLHYGAGMPVLLEAMERGIAAGRALNQPLLTIEWEDYLDLSVEEIAQELGFERGPGDAWAVHDANMSG